MRLTTMTDYAMRLLMYVAQHPDRLCTISEVAGAYEISEAHLMKITYRLGRSGWLETVRGKGGGMRLAAAPSEINLGAVVRSVESDFDIVDCLASDTTCLLKGHCRLSGIIAGALQSFMRHLDAYTLADLLPSADGGVLPDQPARGDLSVHPVQPVRRDAVAGR